MIQKVTVTFYSLPNKDFTSIYFCPQTNGLYTSDIHYRWKGIDVAYIYKSLYNSLPKKIKSWIFTKWIGLSGFR